MSPKESSLAFNELDDNSIESWNTLVQRKQIQDKLAFLLDSELDDQVVRIEGKITVSF